MAADEQRQILGEQVGEVDENWTGAWNAGEHQYLWTIVLDVIVDAV